MDELDKFSDKYRIPSARADWWDYRLNAAYHVTICTKDRICYFGTIADGEMQASAIGKLVEKYWLDIPSHYPFALLGEFVVMPNHFHGILIIDNAAADTVDEDTSTRTGGGKTKDKNPMLSAGLPRIIREFKGRSTFAIRKEHPDFGWQSRYHDQIILKQTQYESISKYIQDNPMNWTKDKWYQ